MMTVTAHRYSLLRYPATTTGNGGGQQEGKARGKPSRPVDVPPSLPTKTRAQHLHRLSGSHGGQGIPRRFGSMSSRTFKNGSESKEFSSHSPLQTQWRGTLMTIAPPPVLRLDCLDFARRLGPTGMWVCERGASLPVSTCKAPAMVG